MGRPEYARGMARVIRAIINGFAGMALIERITLRQQWRTTPSAAAHRYDTFVKLVSPNGPVFFPQQLR